MRSVTDTQELLRAAREEAMDLAGRAERLATLLEAAMHEEVSQGRVRDIEPPGVPGARLLATQMALAGESREVTSARLSGTVGPDALAEILDEAYGA